MRNPPQPYKHADPTHLDYGRSADSSLLNKRRQNFAWGGDVKTAAGSHLTPGATANALEPQKTDTPYMAAERAKLNAAYAQQYPRAQAGTGMSPGAMLDKLGEGTNNPSIQQTKDLAAKFGMDLNATPQAVPTQYDRTGRPIPGSGFGNTTVTHTGPTPMTGGPGDVYTAGKPTSTTTTYNSNGQQIV